MSSPAVRIPADVRLAARIEMEPSSDGCWLWTGALSSQGGYPGFTDEAGHFVYAHRYAYESTYGFIPEGHHVHHRCGRRICVRPDHLEALSPKQHKAIHAAECAAKRAARGAHFRRLRNLGMTAKAIAQMVGLDVSTVRGYLRAVPVQAVAA